MNGNYVIVMEVRKQWYDLKQGFPIHLISMGVSPRGGILKIKGPG